MEKIMQKALSSPHLQQSEPHSKYSTPFMSEARTNLQRCLQPLGIAKPVETVKRVENIGNQYNRGPIQEKSTEKSRDHSKDDDTSQQLSNLHVKLYTEVERIRKWKIATEISIEQKEQKLRDSLQLVESQRKSLLELQIENENLSLRLSEQIENKQEVMQKISATRELCYAAKNHMDILEKRICCCEETRLMVDDINAKRMTEVEVLLRKFEDLSNQHEENVNSLNNAVKIEKEEKEALKSNYTAQLNSSAEELRKLHEALKIKELHNSQLQQEREQLKQHLRENQAIYSDTEKEVNSLRQKLSETQDDKLKMHSLLEISENSIKELERVNSELREEMGELNLKAENTSEEFRNKLIQVECLLAEETKSKRELESSLYEKEKEIQELKESHDNITEKLNESSHQCEDMQKLMEELGRRKLYLEEAVLKQQETLQELELANKELAGKWSLSEDAQKRAVQKEEEINNLKSEHAIKVASLNEKLKEKQIEIDKLKSLNAALEEEIKSKQRKIEDLEKKVKILNKKLKIKTKMNCQSKDKLEMLLETSTKENENLMARTVSLEKELGNAKNEWEAEKEKMKTSHRFEMKEILDLLDKTEENYRNTTSVKEGEIEELKSEITKLSDELKTERRKMQKMENEWEKEKSEMKELHSSQVKDVFDIMKKAEESYQKTILVKEDEAEELRKQISSYNDHIRAEENKDVEIKKLRYENDSLRDMMEAIKKRNETELAKLRSQNDKLNIELETLQQEKEAADRLRDEKRQLEVELDKLKREHEKLTSKVKPKEETKKTAFDALLEDTVAANITHCTVKRSPLVTAEVAPKLSEDFKSRSSPYFCQTEKSGMKRQWMPVTKVKPLQEQKLCVEPKPKQRKFFKSRSFKKQISDKGLLWFDIEEE